MTHEELKQYWRPMCSDFIEIQNNGLCAIHRFMFTYGIVTDLQEHNYSHRWCYKTYEEAQIALKYWDGIGDPPGLWIKYKGIAGEWGNILRPEFNEQFDVVSPHYKP